MRRWWSDARHFQIVALSSLLLINFFWIDFGARPLYAALAIASALVTQVVCSRLFGLPNIDLRSPLITGLSLSLLLRADEPWLPVAAGVIAIASKFVFRLDGKHIWNPAGFAIVVLLFMAATVSEPIAQSLLKAGASDLPFDLRHVNDLVYALSIAGGLAVLFGCLALIYWRVPNREIPWHGVWPGALFTTVVIGVIDVAFPVYLTSISTIDQLGTTLVFVVIVLGWFYVLALTILAGGVVNSIVLTDRSS